MEYKIQEIPPDNVIKYWSVFLVSVKMSQNIGRVSSPVNQMIMVVTIAMVTVM